MNETLKNALILCAITLIAGILLGGVYEMTKAPRREQEIKAQNKAYNYVFDKADKFNEVDMEDLLESLSDALGKEDITNKNVLVSSVVEAISEDELLGYVISVTNKEGFGGDITFSVGIDLKYQVTGVYILSMSETAGLGMNAQNPEFLDQYKVSNSGLFITNKVDSAEGTNIDALTGATITSKAMTKGVNAAIITAKVIVSEREVE
ncbi:MAG: FMN-binding protein [Clostridiales bacterium]|nr:FMN-binding protein [Clostridiales bacterium]